MRRRGASPFGSVDVEGCIHVSQVVALEVAVEDVVAGWKVEFHVRAVAGFEDLDGVDPRQQG